MAPEYATELRKLLASLVAYDLRVAFHQSLKSAIASVSPSSHERTDEWEQWADRLEAFVLFGGFTKFKLFVMGIISDHSVIPRILRELAISSGLNHYAFVLN